VLFVLRWRSPIRSLHIALLRFVQRQRRSPKDYENNEPMRRAISDAGLQRSEVHMDVR
jgi:hypothetical protein